MIAMLTYCDNWHLLSKGRFWKKIYHIVDFIQIVKILQFVPHDIQFTAGIRIGIFLNKRLGKKILQDNEMKLYFLNVKIFKFKD